ncbi:type 1 glutamine amidotransferase [Puia sp.]|jgi:GMP synthase-like glutamine amidotransferase|uniref:type 1 glutamine amidotransferase n=1 Tax=Puia sp. TaxID=2045100 RepID=UPI002F42ABEA
MENQAKIRVAILDLYEGQANQGMRCIREILTAYGRTHSLDLHFDEFEVRLKHETPDLSYQIYISSGGPGSPLDSEGSEWEKVYWNWLQNIESFNADPANADPKQVLFICHSFQLACRHYSIANVTNRKSTAFGVFPVHMLEGAAEEPVFAGLRDPFYAVDSRSYQVIQPDYQRIADMGGLVLAIEKQRPHIPLERAIMAVRFNDNMIGTQFHPEADAAGMSMYLQREDRKATVIAEHGEEKWRSMIEQLDDPDKIRYTYSHVIPNFLDYSLRPTPMQQQTNRRFIA